MSCRRNGLRKQVTEAKEGLLELSRRKRGKENIPGGREWGKLWQCSKVQAFTYRQINDITNPEGQTKACPAERWGSATDVLPQTTLLAHCLPLGLRFCTLQMY